MPPDTPKPRLGPNFPNTNDFWPPHLRNLERGGTTMVNVCVAEDGKLAAAPTIVKSSGEKLLDEAAIAVAKAGTYVPAERDGVPTHACLDYRVRFGNQ